MAVGACAHCPLRPFPAAVAQGTVLRSEPCDTSVDFGRFSHLAAVLPFVARVLQFLAVSRQGDVRYALSRFGKSRGRRGDDSRKPRCLSCDISVAVEPLKADAPSIWVIGTVVFMAWQSMGIRLLSRILNDKTNVRERLPEGSTLLLTSASIPSFSWMHSIVVSVDDYAENGDTILAHERAHIAHRHSLDHLLLLIVQCVLWWNPFLWLLADSLIEVHEYQADMAVLEQGINATQYQLLLIRKAAGPAGIAMVNGFKRNKLKHRIIMMNKTFSLRGAKCRYLALLPMILIAFACTSKVETLEEPSLTNNETLQEDPNLTNATQVTLLVNSAGHIMMVAPGFDAVVVSIEELPEKLGKMDIVNAVVTIKADKDTPMPVITDIKDSLRKLFLNRINYQLYQDSDGK